MTALYDAFQDRLTVWSDIIEYLPLLYDAARSYEKVRVLELGSRRGNSTLAFLAGAEEAGGHVWSNDIDNVIDNPEVQPWADCPLWTFTCGDDMDPDVQARLPAEVDVLFIDTSHEYEHTVRELEIYMPRVAPGGMALFHDTRWTPFLTHEEMPEGFIPPVGLAIDEYCARTGMKWTEIPGKYGLGIIQAGGRDCPA